MKEVIIVDLPKRRDPIAVDLASGKYQQRIVKPRKGKGSHRRNPKHRKLD